MIISPDSYLMEDGKYVWTIPRVTAAWDSARAAARRALFDFPHKPDKLVLLMGVPASGKTTWLRKHEDERCLYIDATFDLPWKRKPWIEMAREAGVPITLVYFQTPLAVCLDRNSKRSSDRMVPELVVRAMWDKMQGSPPVLEEGFARIDLV
jgi:predicted kinase